MVVYGAFLSWAHGDRWRSWGSSAVTNIYIQKSSYFVASSFLVSGVKLLFSAAAHPLAGAGEDALFMYRRWRWPGQTGVVEQPLCGFWTPPATAMCPAAMMFGCGGSWAIWTLCRGWFYWMALGSAGLHPVSTPVDPLLRVTANDSRSSFLVCSAPCGIWCVPLPPSCGGWCNEEEIWKPAGRKSSNLLKKRVYLQTSGPFKQGKQEAEMGQTRSFTFQQRF